MPLCSPQILYCSISLVYGIVRPQFLLPHPCQWNNETSDSFSFGLSATYRQLAEVYWGQQMSQIFITKQDGLWNGWGI
jgi:hypothetical protein